MPKPPRKPPNTSGDLIAEHMNLASEFMRKNRDVIEAVQRHTALLQGNGVLDAMTKAGREMQQVMGATLAFETMDVSKRAGELTASSGAFEEIQQLSARAARATQLPLDEAFRSFSQLADSVKFSIPTIDVEALTGAKRFLELAAQHNATFENLWRMIPASTLKELTQLGATARLTTPTIDPDILRGWAGLDDLYERVAARAQKIAEAPESITAEDVEALFTGMAEMAAQAPAGERGKAVGDYLSRLMWWLFGLAVENDVKKLLGTLLLLMQVAFCGPGRLPAPVGPTTGPEMLTQLPPPALDWQGAGVPEIIRRAGPKAAEKTIEFFTAEIRNPNTRQAYMRAVGKFFNWCDDRNLELDGITPFVVAAYLEDIKHDYAAPTVKQHLAAIRMFFDYLVIAHVIPVNPASSVRGPKHVVKRGKTPVLTADQARHLLDSINTTEVIGLRDRALIGVMVYSLARVSATVVMRVEDYFPRGERWWFRLHEKGGKRHEVPVHHNAGAYVREYIEAAGIDTDKKGLLFRTAGRNRQLTENAMHRSDVLRMVYRRAKASGLDVHTCCHTLRATGITAYLENGGTIENARAIAAHESLRTTKLYDRTSDEITLDEVERIAI